MATERERLAGERAAMCVNHVSDESVSVVWMADGKSVEQFIYKCRYCGARFTCKGSEKEPAD